MKKFLSILIFLIIAIFIWGFWYKYSMQKRVYLTTPSIIKKSMTSVSFEYTTPQKEFDSIYFGTNSLALSNVRRDNFATQKHLIVLKNLHPCTEYFYKIDSTALPLKNKTLKSFKTLCN
ncbi:hypothetical protein [Sulfurimonas sp.]